MLDSFRAGEVARFVDMRHNEDRNIVTLSVFHEQVRASANLRDAARSVVQLIGIHRLNRVDNQELGLDLFTGHQHTLKVGLGKYQKVIGKIVAHPVGAQLNLLLGFLTAHV